MAKLPNVIMVPASSPIRTLAEFVAAAKKKPGMTFASSGNGTSLHLTGELLKLEAGKANEALAAVRQAVAA